jgi:hypothetical protein
MNWRHREPTLNEILSDPIVRALMEADGIDPQEVAATLRQAGLNLVQQGRSSRRAASCAWQGDDRGAWRAAALASDS